MPNPYPEQKCSTCLYYVGPSALERSNEPAQCRADLPTVQIIPQFEQGIGGVKQSLTTVATWPPVKPDQWCGKWTPSIKTKN